MAAQPHLYSCSALRTRSRSTYRAGLHFMILASAWTQWEGSKVSWLITTQTACIATAAVSSSKADGEQALCTSRTRHLNDQRLAAGEPVAKRGVQVVGQVDANHDARWGGVDRLQAGAGAGRRWGVSVAHQPC